MCRERNLEYNYTKELMIEIIENFVKINEFSLKRSYFLSDKGYFADNQAFSSLLTKTITI